MAAIQSRYLGTSPAVFSKLLELSGLPGSRIPVLGLDSIEKHKPDYIIIFPWNLGKEIREQLQYIRDWGGKFVVFIPEISIF